MRRILLVVGAASLVACAKEDARVADSSPAAAAAPAAPAALTDADIAGTWNGQSMPENSDSVISRWTCVQPATGNQATCVDNAAPKDTTVYTYTLSGDSVMFTSAPFTLPGSPGNMQAIDHVVGRKTGDRWTGTSVIVLASKPDSVVSRTRWEATKSP